MAESIKISQKLLDQLKNYNIANQEFVVKFGQIELQAQELNFIKESLVQEWKKQKEAEKALSQTLQNTYGDGNINLETGEFTPIS